MNVLILTPDAVGSTLLQRLITIYMQFHQFDRPVINLHELTNGLVKYYNTTFDQEVLGKQSGSWGYHQSLQQIVEMLKSTDHYKTSRLAHYHLRNRQDPITDQIPFYQYLDDNFYIIACRRHNIFEHALSWSISKVTKKLNVYKDTEKIDNFFDLYRDGIDLDPNSLIQTLNAYKEYINWVNNHFNVASYFYYEEHLPQIEKYVLNLPIFAQQTQRLCWKDKFEMNFDQWNLCHFINSDLGVLALNEPEKFSLLAEQTKTLKIPQNHSEFIKAYHQVADPTWPKINSIDEYRSLPDYIKHEVEVKHGITFGNNITLVPKTNLPAPLIEMLPEQHQKYFDQHKLQYKNSMQQITDLVNRGVMISAPPIKKQTLAEKKHIVRNYQHLLHVYNTWISQNPDLGNPLTEDTLDRFATIETERWTPSDSKFALSVTQNTD